MSELGVGEKTRGKEEPGNCYSDGLVTVCFCFYSYGVKIRAPHALVMTFLFRSGRYLPSLQTISFGRQCGHPQAKMGVVVSKLGLASCSPVLSKVQG